MCRSPPLSAVSSVTNVSSSTTHSLPNRMNSSSPRAPPSAPPTPKRRPTCFVAAKPRASQQKHAHEINRLDLYRDRRSQPTVSGPRPAPYPVIPPFHCRRSDRSPRTVNRMHFASSMEPMTPRELLSYVLDSAEVTELDGLPDESLRIFAPTPSPAYTTRQWRRRPATASPRRGDPYSLPAYLKGRPALRWRCLRANSSCRHRPCKGPLPSTTPNRSRCGRPEGTHLLAGGRWCSFERTPDVRCKTSNLEYSRRGRPL